MEIRSRHHLRSDAVRDLEDTLSSQFGITLEGDSFERVEFADADVEVVLVDGAPLIAYFDGDPAPTVQGANVLDPDRHLVTVDAGAISFVSDGADVMRPGIEAADEAITPGDLVVIVEETHGKALAIGRSRVAGDDLLGDEGKVIDSIHHVGDELFQFSP